MGLILKGRRAKRYLGLAKSKLAALRLSFSGFITSGLKIPAGKIVVQLLGPTNDRIIIETRDPYLVTHVVNDGTTQNLYGGITGEPFIHDAATIRPAGTSEVRDNRITAVGAGLTLRTAIIPPEVYIRNRELTGGGETEYLMDIYFLVGDYTMGVERFIPTQWRVAASSRFNDAGAPIVDIVPIGESAKGRPHAYAIMSIETGTVRSDYHYLYHVIMHFDDVSSRAAPVAIWPKTTTNNNHPELATIVQTPCCYARGNVCFVQQYASDPFDGFIAGVNQPDLIRLTGFGASFTTTPLLTAFPALDKPEYKVDTFTGTSLFIFTGPCVGMVATGVDKMVFVCQAGTQQHTHIFRTEDGGANWTEVANAVAARSDIYWPREQIDGVTAPNPLQEASNLRFEPLISLQAGHAEFVTQSVDTGALTRWMSLDHGATWTQTALTAGRFEQATRGPAFAAPVLFNKDGSAKLVAKINPDKLDDVRVDVYDGLSATKSFSVRVPTSYGTSVPFSRPKLCFFGSHEYPAPIKVGHPKFLEYPE